MITNDIIKACLGNNEAAALYLGSQLLFQKKKSKATGRFSEAGDYSIRVNGQKVPLTLNDDFEFEIEVSDMSDYNQMFYNLKKLVEIYSLPACNNISTITGAWYMFAGCNSLQHIGLQGFDTSNFSEMSWMFSDCSAIENLDFEDSNFDTSKVKYMSGMFNNCKSLKNLNLGNCNFDTSNVTLMNNMFNHCENLVNLGDFRVKDFNVSKVKSMSKMFCYATNFDDFDFENWNTECLEDMSGMFSNITTTNLDLTPFNTSNVLNMSNLFYNSTNLKSVNLDSFNTSNVLNMSGMFRHVNINNLHFNNWNVENVTNMSEMFDFSISLSNVTGSISNIKVNLSLSWPPLTNASAMVFINGLSDEITDTKTITFKATTYDTLTEEQIALATSKGWSVVSA